MQNYLHSGTLPFSTPKHGHPVNKITIKFPQCIQILDKRKQFFFFRVFICFQYLSFPWHPLCVDKQNGAYKVLSLIYLNMSVLLNEVWDKTL